MKPLTSGHHFTVYKTLASPAAMVSLFTKGLLCTKHQAHVPICLIKSAQYPSKVNIIMTQFTDEKTEAHKTRSPCQLHIAGHWQSLDLSPDPEYE